MDNIINTTSLETNIFNEQYTENINLNNFSYNINSNISLISTIISKEIIKKNKTNNLLSSELNAFSEEKINSENSAISSTLTNMKNNEIEQIQSSTPHTLSKYTFIQNQNINNFINNKTNQRTELSSISLSYINFNNKYFNSQISESSLNINISNQSNNLSIFDNPLNETNISNSSNITINENKSSFLPKNLTVPKIHKAYDTNLVLGLGISIPIILIILVILICYYIKKKREKINQINNFDINRINFKNPGLKLSYNKLQNTSNINANINSNNISMSEIKVQNLKDEIHNIITNSSGGSNSSGRRKRDKKRGNKNNNKIPGYSEQQGNKEFQNDMNEQIKQYVIDEHINN